MASFLRIMGVIVMLLLAVVEYKLFRAIGGNSLLGGLMNSNGTGLFFMTVLVVAVYHLAIAGACFGAATVLERTALMVTTAASSDEKECPRCGAKYGPEATDDHCAKCGARLLGGPPSRGV
jgi:hypothetical protein